MMIRPPQAMETAVVAMAAAVVAVVAPAASFPLPRCCFCGAAGSTSPGTEHRYHSQIRHGQGTNMREKSAVSPLLLALFSCMSLPVASAAAPGPHSLAPGQVIQVLSLRPLIDMAEGIAIDNRGHIFISNRRLENDTRVCE